MTRIRKTVPCTDQHLHGQPTPTLCVPYRGLLPRTHTKQTKTRVSCSEIEIKLDSIARSILRKTLSLYGDARKKADALYCASRCAPCQHSNNCAVDTSYTIIIAITGTPTFRRTETHPGKPGAQTPLSFLRGVWVPRLASY